jgi:hypothetical protein
MSMSIALVWEISASFFVNVCDAHLFTENLKFHFVAHSPFFYFIQLMLEFYIPLLVARKKSIRGK